MSDSDSSSSSSDRSTPVVKKSKGKGKKKTTSEVTGRGKNEGVDLNRIYKPPTGFTVVQNEGDAGEFDWDTVANDDDLELWLIRVPDSIKPKYLENTTIEPSVVSKTMRTATLSRKHATFDVWSIGEEDDHGVGGEEIKSLSCLLPRKSKKGTLYPAPKPITRHFVVSAQPVVPTSDISPTGAIAPYSRPSRENYPTEVLKHRFLPYGALSNATKADTNETHEMDVDPPVPAATELPTSPAHSKKSKPANADSPVVDTKKAKGKKRKGDVRETVPEKKTKKAKTS